jgi:hypothetical protein
MSREFRIIAELWRVRFQTDPVPHRSSPERSKLYRYPHLCAISVSGLNALSMPAVAGRPASGPSSNCVGSKYSRMASRGSLCRIKSTTCSKGTRCPRTVKKYRSTLMKLFGRCQWERIVHATPRSFTQWRNRCGLGGKTLNDLLAAARSFFDWLECQRMLLENPFKYPLSSYHDSTLIF